jgi:hypothetical protein
MQPFQGKIFCCQNGAVAVHRAKKQWRIVLKGTAATDF